MKICFSTLGCPDWSYNEIIATAKDFKYDGIEVRGIANELYVPNIKQFSSDNIDSTKDELKNLGLEICCLTSACYLHDKENTARVIEEAKEYIDTASQLGTPYVRVLGDTSPAPDDNVDLSYVKEGLKELVEYSKDKSVTVLIESNGVLADTYKLKELLKYFDSNDVGVVWDIHHPYRFMNETIEESYNNLRDFIKHIHMKNSVSINGSYKYKMIGEGDIPIKHCLEMLKKDNYSEYISLEWVKRWYKDLEEPGVVFLEFVNYIKDMWGKS